MKSESENDYLVIMIILVTDILVLSPDPGWCHQCPGCF